MEEWKISVLMAVYHAEKPEYLNMALKSILIDQNLMPDQVILMIDGPIGLPLEEVIHKYQVLFSNVLECHRIESNCGLGNALKHGLLKCRNEIVARMDTDDISIPDRFKQQQTFLMSHTDISVVGSNIEEFENEPGDLRVIKKLPESSEEIKLYSKKRCPLNHPSIMFRKSHVLDSGGYSSEFYLFEDYSLYSRMIVKGYKFYNIQNVLLKFRVGEQLAMIRRRSGWKYMRSEVRFLLYAYKIGHLDITSLVRSLLIRVPVRLMPNVIVRLIYSSFLRR